MRKLRVKVRTRDGGWERVQLLQERRWWGWKTIDSEIVPRHVIIALGCFGDTDGWVSKFTKLGRFGRDGHILPHDNPLAA